MAIKNARIEDAFPLSSLQQGMIFHSQQDTDLSVYHDVITFPLVLDWEAGLFKQALAYMVAKHPMLRTRFRLEKGRALQVVLSELEGHFEVIDLTTLQADKQQVAIAEWIEAQKRQGIDLSQELWRISMLQLDKRKWQFGLSMHHALMDGWSVASFCSELFETYRQLQALGQLPELNSPPSYKYFIQAEQQALADDTQRRYWQDTFSDAKVPWWSGSRKTASVRFTCDISLEQSQAAVALAAKLGIQEKSLWCSTYLVLLSMLDGTSDIVGSVVTHGRPEMAGAESTLGLFLNSLPIRMDIQQMTWSQLLVQVDEQLRQQYQKRHFPLVNIQMLTGLDFSASMFNFMNFHVYGEQQEGQDKDDSKDTQPALSGFDETNYLFSVNVQKQEAKGRHLFVINAEPSVFDPAFCQRIHDYAANIIRGMLATPEAEVNKAELLGGQERRQLLQQWNATAMDFSRHQSLHHLFEQQVENNPEAIALDYQSEQLTYTELNAKANRLAHYLILKGVVAEQRVGIYLSRSSEMLVAILAVLKAGGCYVPLDPAYPQSRISYLLQDAKLAYLISTSVLPATGPEVGRIDLDSDWGSDSYQKVNPNVASLPEQLAYVIYTSGSTGQPKGVALCHQGIVSLLNWARNTLDPEDIKGVLASTSMCFDLSVYEFFLPLSTGNTCILIDNILLWNEQARRELVPVTLINTVPSVAKALLEQQAIPSCVKVINLAGEPLKANLVDQLYAQTCVERVYDLYGPSEDTTYSTAKLRHKGAPESIGAPVANTQAYILDGQGELCPQGVVGELYLGGDSLARGYLQRPGLTAERFLPNPFSATPGARMYRTGDLVRYLAEPSHGHGQLKYLGRTDHQIKLRGFRIELGEIESVLLTHEKVRDAVVMINDKGQNGTKIVAYLVTHGEAPADFVEHLRTFLQDRLPLHMLPSILQLLDQLPLTPNGKVDRKALPDPDLSEQTEGGGLEPQGEIERLLAGAWCGILQCHKVARNQSFFNLGGNSLHISRLALRIRELFAVSLPLSTLFERTTIQAQSQAITASHRQQAPSCKSISPSLKQGPIPVSYAQQPLCFFDQLMGASATYNMQLALRLKGELDLQALRRALQTIIERHEVLRARFVPHNNQMVQIIDQPYELELPVKELSGSSQLKELYTEQANHLFSLADGKLINIALAKETQGIHLLLVNMHHIVSDGGSLGIFMHELFTLYQAFAKDAPSPLLPLAIQYGDYAQWQREQDNSRLLEYWREQLIDMPPLLELPTDRPRPLQQTFSGSTELLQLPLTLSESLLKLSQQQGVTLFTTLLSAFALLLGRYAGQDDVAIGTPVANRHQPGTEALIGFLANTLVMRCDLSANPSFVELLNRTRNMAIKGFAHQDLPFGQLVEALNPQRNISHSPLFQAMFAMQDKEVGDLPKVSGLDIEPLYFQGANNSARFDLTLNLVETEKGIGGVMEYNRDLFDRTSIERMLHHFHQLLEDIVANPKAPLSQLNFIGAQEKLQLQCWSEPNADRKWQGNGSQQLQQAITSSHCYVVRELAEQQFELCPIGVPGELLLSSKEFSQTELKENELHRENGIDNPFSTNVSHLYRTGELVRWCADGSIEFIAKLDSRIKVNGYRIELNDIEEVINSDPLVSQSLVILADSQSGDKKLLAYVLADEAARQLNDFVQQLKQSLQSKLPPHMLPAGIMLLDEWPLTSDRTIDRRALPAPALFDRSTQYQAPKNDTEKALCQIWQQVLNVDVVGIDDNFFSLGGDSILSIQVVSKAKRHNLKLTVKLLFEHQNIRELAPYVGEASIRIDQAPCHGTCALMPIQHALLSNPLDVIQHFTQSLILGVPQDFDGDKLTAIVQTLVQRHDALRLVFGASGAEFVEYAQLDLSTLVKVHDISALCEQQQEAFIQRTGAKCKSGFDIATAPLFKAHYFNTGHASGGRLLLVAHHLVVDGVSWRILIKDLHTAYTQLAQQKTLLLPAKTSSVKQWAKQLQLLANSDVVRQQQDFWLTQLKQKAPAFPVDRPLEGADLYVDSANTHIFLNRQQTAKLLGYCQHAYHTQIEELLLAALMLGYQQWSGNNALKVALEGHGRAELGEDLDLSETVGWFTSLYPLFLSTPDYVAEHHHESLAALIKTVKEQLRQIPQQGLGFGLLRHLDPRPLVAVGEEQTPALLFNYLGNFTRSGADDSLFPLQNQDTGADIGANFVREYLLDVTGAVVDGNLEFTISYNSRRHDVQSIQAFGEQFQNALENLVSHCCQVEHRGFTPSDFPLIALGQADIDGFIERYPNLENIYPATDMQVGLMFHSLLDESGQSYSTQLTFSLNGRFQVANFQKAWALVVARHDVLRSALVGRERARILQLVVDEVEIPWQLQDLCEMSLGHREQAFEALCEKHKRQGFDMQQAPLMRMALCRMTDSEYRWVWTHHHSILDGWSVSLLLNEVFQCYMQLCKGLYSEQGKGLAWRNYVAWLAQQNRQQALDYWRAQLAVLSEPTRLGIDKGVKGNAPASQDMPLEEHLNCNLKTTNGLKQAARYYGVTLNTLIQAAWAYLLSRNSGQSQVVFGQTLSGRAADVSGIDRMVGLFIASVPVVVDISPAQSIDVWLKAMQQAQSEREVFSYLPLADIQSCSPFSAEQALFDSLVVFENFPVGESVEGINDSNVAELEHRLRVETIQVSEGTNYGLTLLVGQQDSLILKLSYQSQRYSQSVVASLLQQLQRVLSGLADTQLQQVRDIPYLQQGEQQLLLDEWNRTEQVFPAAECLHRLFERQVEKCPQATALVYAQQTLSYEQLNGRANQLAHHLIQSGINPEARVGICLKRSPEMLIAILAVLKAGACYVPMDPAYPAARIAYLMEDSGLACLVCESGAALDGLPADVPLVKLDQCWQQESYSHANPMLAVLPEQLAYVIFTSGSTGRPKGVALAHSGAVSLLRWALTVLSDEVLKGVLASTSVCFDLSIYELFLPLVSGNSCILADSIIDWCPAQSHKDYPVTLINTVPSAAKMLLDSQTIGEDVKVINLAGEPLKASLVDALYEQSGVQAVYDLYGPSEYTTYSTWTLRQAGGQESIGRPLANTRVYLLDQFEQACAIGYTGELCLTGAGLARGYLDNPAATALKFIPNPYAQSPGERLYRTGDLACYNQDGNLLYMGRLDHQIKLRGFRIEMGEIENQLLRDARVRDVVVVARDQGQVEARLVAYLVLVDGYKDSDAILSQLNAQLATQLPVHMLPSDFVLLDALPLTPNGKVNREALPEAQLRRQDFETPQTQTEELLACLWCDLLQLDRVGRTESFFQLGGNSVLAMRLTAQVSKEFELDLPMKSLFDSPTIKELASLIEFLRFDDFDADEELDSPNNYLELDI